MTIKRGRQMGKTLKEIRDDHVFRYRAAAEMGHLHNCETAADIGAGFGYGSYILAQEGSMIVTGYDNDPGVIPWAEEHYSHPSVTREVLDLREGLPKPFDLVVGFEVLEHFKEAPEFLEAVKDKCKLFVGSVPNENVVPFGGPSIHPQHVRHYTPDQFRQLFVEAGWTVMRMGSQPSKRGPNARVIWGDFSGRTLVIAAQPFKE